ncbi:hypothetical protein ABW19_dt0205910 [Dactylella cylindrospora]|nr:hypothetical protein ABW19_dt0205910 [Dactylella cylindrospora]
MDQDTEEILNEILDTMDISAALIQINDIMSNDATERETLFDIFSVLFLDTVLKRIAELEVMTSRGAALSRALYKQAGGTDERIKEIEAAILAAEGEERETLAEGANEEAEDPAVDADEEVEDLAVTLAATSLESTPHLS